MVLYQYLLEKKFEWFLSPTARGRNDLSNASHTLWFHLTENGNFCLNLSNTTAVIILKSVMILLLTFQTTDVTIRGLETYHRRVNRRECYTPVYPRLSPTWPMILCASLPLPVKSISASEKNVSTYEAVPISQLNSAWNLNAEYYYFKGSDGKISAFPTYGSMCTCVNMNKCIPPS